MRILFLDFDGVLNDDSFFERGGGESNLSKHIFLDKYSLTDNLDWDKVARLNEIVHETGCFIVLSTAWRYLGLDDCKNVLMMKGFKYPHRIIDLTPDVKFDNDSRVQEVMTWLILNDIEKDISSYVMLDDDIHRSGENKIGKEHCVITYFCEETEGGLNPSKKREVVQKLLERSNDEW